MAGEFELIKKKLSGHDHGPGVILGIGDDCALLQPQKGRQLAVTTDTMVEGRHFFAGTRADYLGWRALAVNLSDLAAMGARPVWFLLSLNLPEGSKQWVADFARGLFALADREKIPLIGGNMSAGPLSITITAAGAIKPERAMLRSAARPGDGIYVTGTLGGCGLYVKAGMGEVKLSPELYAQAYKHSFMLPVRTEFARKAARYCRCAIDLSDGLAGDLRHILLQSRAGAEIRLENLPLAPVLQSREAAARLSVQERLDLAVYGGCDYELLLTLPPKLEPRLLQSAKRTHTPVTRIGTILPAERGVHFLYQGRRQPLRPGFEHF